MAGTGGQIGNKSRRRVLDIGTPTNQADRVDMNVTARLIILIAVACLVSGTPVFAGETNAVASPMPPAMVNGYLQIQEQLHDTQMAIERNRQQAEAEARRNANDMAARIRGLEQTIADQRANEVEATQKTQQLMLILAGAFGTIGLLVILLMAYLQWRTVARLVELSSSQPAGMALGNGHVSPSLLAGASVEQSNARLFSMVDQLEKRILELKQVAHAPLNGTHLSAVHETNGASQGSNDRDECVANLLAEGQSLLVANEPRKALECFDTALGLQPKHADALVKKGGALEKLGQLDEAIACYDRAIEMDGGMTIAYLHKGGLFNRLSRYDEALHCYEQALRTQEKRAPEEKAVA
jgi:tetratricopeptide (TPR) repeat protein